MKLSSKSHYALEGLLYIALREKNAVSAKELSGYTGATAAYLEQIFFRLKRAGIVTAVRGAKGGFVLARAPEGITVRDVILAVEGTMVPVKCVADLSACTSRVRDACLTRTVWVRVSQAMERAASGITLASLRDKFRQEHRDAGAGGGAERGRDGA